MKHFIIILTLLSFAVVSCDSEDSIDCFKKTGEEIEVEIALAPFHSIKTEDEIDLYLMNGSQKVILKGGKNLLLEIDLSVKDGVLTIFNANSCNWVREAGNPAIYIQSDLLEKINLFDYANLYSESKYSTDTLEILSDGTGDINLEIEGDLLNLTSTFIGNITLGGRLDHLEIQVFNDARLIANELKARVIKFEHTGSNDLWLFPVDSISGLVTQNGHIYLFNRPTYQNLSIEGAGKIFEMYEN